jgi:galactose mutarotase-like enzyme
MPYRQTTVAGLPALALFNEELELVAVPSAGARITHLRRRNGREWLWRNPQLPLSVPPIEIPRHPTIYVDRYDSGGWDECFPTVGACPLPGAPADAPPLPDHGELWCAEWQHDLLANAEITTWRSVVTCRTVPAEFQREITLDGDRIHFDYRLRSLGTEPFPYLWCAHPLFTLQPGTLLELPGVSRARVAAVQGRHDFSVGSEVPWPLDGGAGFRVPETGGWAAKLFLESAGTGGARLTDPTRGETLELQWDATEVPLVGLWLNLGGWSPAGEPYVNLAIEPCLAAPDRLDEAVESWGLAPILPPQGERVWRLTVALREPDF